METQVEFRKNILKNQESARKLSENQLKSTNLLKTEFYFIERLLLIYPGHETHWYHRRFVMYHWLILSACYEDLFHTFVWDYEYFEEFSDDKEFKGDEFPWPSVQRELELCDHCLKDDMVSRFEDQYRFASMYKLWILQMAIAVLSSSEYKVSKDFKQLEFVKNCAKLSLQHIQHQQANKRIFTKSLCNDISKKMEKIYKSL